MFQRPVRPTECSRICNRRCLERTATRCDRALFRFSLVIFLFAFVFMVMSSAAAGLYWRFINTQPWKPNTDEYQLRWLVAILLGVMWFLTTAITVTYFLKLFSKIDYTGAYTPMVPAQQPESAAATATAGRREPFEIADSSHATSNAQGDGDGDIEN